ncbi:GNAT family N-acetyltransferase [Ekhidna sp.]|uniref:GNAT family N-acetyltransferase n=1 Tax=Ekhidna sp. TaxID=2608089 RepID=UPI003CCBEF43
MMLNIYTSPERIAFEKSLTYYQSAYFQSQTYNQFTAYSTEQLFLPLDIIGESAISIPKSPFGSVVLIDHAADLQTFISEVKKDLKEKGVSELVIHHPCEIYKDYPAVNVLEKLGAQLLFNDSNQHILLNEKWEDTIHQMQVRKLKALQDEGFTFRKMEKDELETAYKFLAVCRQTQGLQINIGWEHLQKLSEKLPGKYECFGVFREGKISALCISVNVTEDVAYYYLPATSPMFRNQSPMVMLIAGMVEHYRDEGYKYLDLGVSSIEGRTQETLKIFKERMGGVSTTKPTLKFLL